MAVIKSYGNIHLGQGAAFVFSKGKGKQTTHTIFTPEAKSANKIVKWGENNQFPQDLHKTLRLNGAGNAALRILKATHYGQGFQIFTEEVDKKTDKRDRKLKSIKDYPKINTFFKQNKMKRFWTEHIADLEHLAIAFPEFILSKDFSKILSVRRQPASKIRYEKLNEKTGLIENVYFSHNWTSELTPESEFVEKIPVIDSYWSAEQIKEYCKKNKIHKFIMPVFYPMMTETYYPVADWHAVFHNGWMDVSNSIPEYKKYLFENQLNIKFIVHISEEYFTRTYQDEWQDYKPEKKKEIRDQLTEAIDKHLSGSKNSGKSIQSVTYKDIAGNWVKGIEVDSINNGVRDGDFLPEASASNSEIMFAAGVDPSIVGAGIPGGKMNTGSGSDKREAFSILTSLFKTKREISLEPWTLLQAYNGWDENLEATFANMELTTLDKNPTGMQTNF